MSAKKQRGLKVIGLFSGCGGLDLGLKWAGFRNVACVERDTDCCDSLRSNKISLNVVNADIKDIQGDDLLKLSGLEPGELDLLAGGPPCPPYSKSRFYLKSKPRGLEDPTSDTLLNYLRLLKELRPRAFLIENVPGMAYKVHSAALNLVLETAKELGFRVTYKILNAADYGVPQIRERLFIVGTRPGHVFDFPKATHCERSKQLSLLDSQPWVSVGAVLSDLDTTENADDTGHKAGGRHYHLLEQVPPGDNYLHFTSKRGHPSPEFEWRSRYWSFLLKLHPDQPSWTIQAKRSNNMGPFHWRNRILRILEIKRLQTFPDDFVICGKVESAWRQIGNAVPPLLAKKIGEGLAVLNTTRTHNETGKYKQFHKNPDKSAHLEAPVFG